MNGFSTLGRIFFGLLLFVVGAQHFIYATFVATLVPAWIPFRYFWACFVGAAFVAAGLAIVFRKQARLAATLLGIMFLLFVLIVHTPRIFIHPQNSNEWTSGFVALAMAGGAVIVASASRNERYLNETNRMDKVTQIGRSLYGLAMIAFGVQHFIFARLGVGIGPPWFPVRPLWTYLAGAAIFLAGLAIMLGRSVRVAAFLLGALLLLLFLFQHLPGLLTHPHDPGKWASGFEILGMSGAAFALLGTLRKANS